MRETVKKVVLAYSGGLDTSVILRWIQETYRCEVVTFTADLGQGEELEPARRRPRCSAPREIFIDDLREEFVRDFVFPMFRASALRGRLPARHLDRPAADRQAPGRDRAPGRRRRRRPRRHRQGQRPGPLRAHLYALDARHQGHRAVARVGPERPHQAARVRRAAPDPDARDKRGEAPFSVDANLLHISAEGKVLEDPWVAPEEFVFSRTVAPEDAPDTAEYVAIAFERGDPVAVNGEQLAPAALLQRLTRSAASTASAGSTSSRTALSA